MKSKVGITYAKSKGENKPVLQDQTSIDFVSVVDGVTFGILGGQPFHSGNKGWEKEAQIRWAEANAQLFGTLERNLRAYAATLKKEP